MKKVSKYIILICCLLIFVILSCNKTRRSGIDRSDVIPEDEMVGILTDLYLTDGLMNYPPIRSDFSEKDSIETYIDVIHEHGYTKEEVDRSMEYYFIDKPKKYAAIYDRVIEKLSGMEADLIQQLSKESQSNRNLWEGERTYSLPDAGVSNPIEFSVRTVGMGQYLLRFRLTLYEDDQSLDPFTDIWFWYDDGTEEGAKIPWDRYDLEKTGRPEMITLSKALTDPRVTHLRGKLLNHTDQPGHWEKHAIVTNISINREVDVLEQDAPR
jgi:hypothetical protein